MEVLHLAEVDSTSTYASQLVAQGKQTPFLVHADRQTAGRGRRGNQWQSPTGNLYLTLALPTGEVAPELGGLLPLKAGVVVAQLLEAAFGLRVTLKWPNDILFAGRKLGGLLLETSVTAGQMGELLVGLGLNVASAPDLPGPYAAVALSGLLGRSCRVEALVAKVATEFLPAWDRLALPDVLSAYQTYQIAAGHLWCHDELGLAAATRLAGDGSLQLKVLSSGAELSLTSVEHGWRWLHQDPAAAGDAPLLVADIGNTAVKLAAFRPAFQHEPAAVESWRHSQPLSALQQALTRLKSGILAEPWPLFICSVRPSATAVVAEAAASLGLSPQHLGRRMVRRWGYHTTALGEDRLAGIEAWLGALTPAERQVKDCFGVLVQAGTATTIDVVKTDGEHLGGLILPGLSTALASLHQVAALLPQIDAAQITQELAARALGRDTVSAMICAAVAMTTGAVERTIAKSSVQYRAQLLPGGLILSGGSGQLLAQELGAVYRPHLGLQGIRCMALGGSL